MGALEFEGLLYLISGICAFLGLAAFLRIYSYSFTSKQVSRSNDATWQEPEFLRIAEIIEESPDIKSFRLVRKKSMPFNGFRAGQFLSFQIGDDAQTTRSYSLSSSPYLNDYLQISVKRIDGGVGSSWLHARCVGDEVWTYPPQGGFTDHYPEHHCRIYIAGGVGITPFISMIMNHEHGAMRAEVHLFFGARKQEDLIYHDYFKHLSQRSQRLHYYPILSQEHHPAAPLHRGHITWQRIQDWAQLTKKNQHDVLFFLCGPTAMSDALLPHIEDYVATDEQIITEKFISPTTADVASFPEIEAAISWQDRSFSYRGRQNLLSFLEGQGESLPFACRSGVCGSCRCKIQGDYFQLTDAGLSRSEKKSGWALSCVSYPRGDLKVSL